MDSCGGGERTNRAVGMNAAAESKRKELREYNFTGHKAIFCFQLTIYFNFVLTEIVLCVTFTISVYFYRRATDTSI